MRDYRQRNVEKLREEIAAEVFYVSQLRYKQQEVGLDDAKALEMIYEAMARKIRIRLLESGAATEQLEECFNLEEKLLDEIRSNPARQAWTLDENVAVNQRIGALGDLYRNVLKSEMQAAAEEHAL